MRVKSRKPAAAKRSMVAHVQAMLDFQARGAQVMDYGNNIRQMAQEEGLAGAFGFLHYITKGPNTVSEHDEEKAAELSAGTDRA